jgi:hypothetical protein
MKAQTSTEFVILTTFMLLVFLVFLVLIQSKMSESIKEKNDLLAQNVMDKVITEIRLAESVTDDYKRTFILPTFFENGIPYTISIYGYSSGGGELVIRYENIEKVYFLDTQIDNASTIGLGSNRISKSDGIITITHI